MKQKRGEGWRRVRHRCGRHSGAAAVCGGAVACDRGGGMYSGGVFLRFLTVNGNGTPDK